MAVIQRQQQNQLQQQQQQQHLPIDRPRMYGWCTRATPTRIVSAILVAAMFVALGASVFHRRRSNNLSQQQWWGEVKIKSAPARDGSSFRANVENASADTNNNDDMTFDGVTARVFAMWPDQNAFPCYPPNPGDELLHRAWQDHASATRGLLYEKPNKCASTTLAGVNVRIARNVARRSQHDVHPNLNLTLCDVRWSHGRKQRAERYRHRNRTMSFLWSAVREPTSRAVSWYYFKHLSLDGHNHSDDQAFQDFLLRQKDHFYLFFLNTRPYRINDNWSDAASELNFVLQEYDFIGVTERLDESLVVLMLLLKLPMADVLYYSSKVHSGLFARGPGTKCFYLQPSSVSDEMRSFFASEAWSRKIRSDMTLYRAVNRSLDMTIDALGRHRVEIELARFRQAQALVRQRCQGKVQMPCDKEGDMARPVEETGCLVGDVGCGMECLDEVATELELWP
jgi:Sulfotransferase family